MDWAYNLAPYSFRATIRIAAKPYIIYDNATDQKMLIAKYYAMHNAPINLKPCCNKLWQTIVEDSIDVFEMSDKNTGLFNLNDAYQILLTSLKGYVDLNDNLKTFVRDLVVCIHGSPVMMKQILTTKHICRHNIYFIDKLMINFLKCNDINGADKEITFRIFLSNLEKEFDINVKTRMAAMKNIGNNYDIKLQLTIESVVLAEDYLTTNEIIDILIATENNIINQGCLAILSIRNKYNYDVKKIANIFKKIIDNKTDISLQWINNTSNYTFCIESALINSAVEHLALIKYYNESLDIVDDDYIFNAINDMDTDHIMQIKELYYKAGRMCDYQILTIANNSNKLFYYRFEITDTVENFELEPGQRKEYRNLRAEYKNTCTKLLIYNDKMEHVIPFVDFNSYISVYGSAELKINIYYEPDALDALDASAEGQNLPEQLVYIVSNLLKKYYDLHKKMYPSMLFDTFIKQLESCSGYSDSYDPDIMTISNELNTIARPSQVKKVIDFILGNND
jgi:hypothetical protein